MQRDISAGIWPDKDWINSVGEFGGLVFYAYIPLA